MLLGFSIWHLKILLLAIFLISPDDFAEHRLRNTKNGAPRLLLLVAVPGFVRRIYFSPLNHFHNGLDEGVSDYGPQEGAAPE